MAALYRQYALDHPDWRVEVELMSGQIPQEHARLLAQARNGTAPDCSSLDSYQVPLFIRQGLLQPVDHYFTPQDVADLFPFVRPVISDGQGHIYAWWWTTDVRMLYRDTTRVPMPPQTWADTQQAALVAKAGSGASSDGIVFNGGRNEVTMIDFLPLFWSQGGNLVDPNGKPVFGQEPNRTYLLNALTYYRNLVLSGAAPARVASIVSYDELVADAVAGRTAMMVNGDWAYSTMQAAMPPKQFARWAVSMLPGPTTAQRSTASGGWSFVAFSKDPDKVAACMDLVRQVYLGPAVVALRRLPTSRRLFDTLPMFQDPFYQQVKAFLEYAQVRPSLPIYVAISNSLQIAISEVLAGLREPQAALANAVARVNNEAARYGDTATPR